MTVFIPTDEAWGYVPGGLRMAMTNGSHWQALQFVFKRHVIQGKPLTLTDYRERTFTMMNDEKVIMRRRGRLFQLNWPRVNRVARIIEGREIAGTNGYIYLIDNVLIYEPDLSATACERFGNFDLLIFVVLAYLLLNRQIKTATANCNT